MALPAHEVPAVPASVEERAEIVYTDALTAWLIERAVRTLATVRSPLGPDDPAVRLSCLVSLHAEAEGSIEEAVAVAYEAGHDWDDIAMRLAVFPVDDVTKRFGPYVAWRAAGRPLPIRPTSPRTGEDGSVQ
ncbi:MAG TPA: hypothetical protein VED59_00115 [Acidimicrobiales bacterium]|nr:hypothetical protein [Acidimicrobiales bacterium]